jgi:tetraacyldisaccharide 4'-kinase
MVRAPDRFCAGGSLIRDFPIDRPASPAWLTVPASKIYGWFAARYHRRWDSAQAYRPAVPVISIGNMTVGGAGKTPTVIALARFLRERFSSLAAENAIAVLSRGYGRRARDLKIVEFDSDWRDTGDEPLMIKRAIPEAAVVVHPDRCLAADHAVRKLGSRLLLLDDGFQHRRITRDLDIVLVDGEHPWGNGFLLPAGPLREPARDLKRATAIIGVGAETVHAREIAKLAAKPFLAVAPHVKEPPVLANGSTRRVFAVAAIARPERFINSLLNLNLNVVGSALFRDHHEFSPSDLRNILKKCELLNVEAIATTEKDLVRLGSWQDRIPLVPFVLELEWQDPERLYEMLTEIVENVKNGT